MTQNNRKLLLLPIAGALLLGACAHRPLSAPCEPASYASAQTDCDPKPINVGFAAVELTTKEQG